MRRLVPAAADRAGCPPGPRAVDQSPDRAKGLGQLGGGDDVGGARHVHVHVREDAVDGAATALPFSSEMSAMTT